MRAEDLVARGSGETSSSSPPSWRPAGSARRSSAQRLTDAVGEPLELEDGPTLKPTATVGVAVAEPGDGVEGMLARADAAMYANKARRQASAQEAP